ncbi:hypothetical protein BOX15_Mlig019388g2, partial [Macrostomum lignano]
DMAALQQLAHSLPRNLPLSVVAHCMSLGFMLTGSALALHSRSMHIYTALLPLSLVAITTLALARRFSIGGRLLLRLWLGHLAGAVAASGALPAPPGASRIDLVADWLHLLSAMFLAIRLMVSRLIYPLLGAADAARGVAWEVWGVVCELAGLCSAACLLWPPGHSVWLWLAVPALSASCLLLRMHSCLGPPFTAAALAAIWSAVRTSDPPQLRAAPLALAAARILGPPLLRCCCRCCLYCLPTSPGPALRLFRSPLARAPRVRLLAFACLAATDAFLCVSCSLRHSGASASFPVAAAAWLCLRCIRLALLWQLSRRLRRPIDSDDGRSEAYPLAQLGVWLLSACLAADCLLTAFGCGADGGLRMPAGDPLTAGVFALVISLDATALSTCCQLTDSAESAASACLAYALVLPAAWQPPCDSPPALLQRVRRFLACRGISCHACDLPAALPADLLKHRLRDLFDQTGSNGRLFHTYIVYYCGPSGLRGDWLTSPGEPGFDLDSLLRLWNESPASRSSRLLVVSDAEHGRRWLPAVRALPQSVSVALQTHTGLLDRFTPVFTSRLAELPPMPPASPEGARPKVGLVYAVSPGWSAFAPPAPACRLCDLPSRLRRLLWSGFAACRRCRMQLCPPPLLDTGLGFSLLTI